MLDITITDINALVAFWLVFCRWSAALVLIPLLDEVAIPGVVKILFCLLIAFTFYPQNQVAMMNEIRNFGLDNLVFLTMGEVLIGLAIGTLANSFLSIFNSAGTLMAQQIGFGAARYFDQNMGGTTGPLEKLLTLTISMMILTSGALLPMFKGIFNSFQSVTIARFFSIPNSPELFFDIFKGLFSASLFLASPILISNLLTVGVVGIIARSVPQLNILTVSFIINIGLGLIVLLNISHEFFNVGFRVYTDFLGKWFQLLL